VPIPTVISVAGTAARSDAKPFAAAGALGVVGIALDLARPWPLAIAIDHAIDGRPLFGWSPTTVLVLAAVALVALTAAAGLIDMAAELYSERAAERVGFRLRQELFDRAMTLSLRWHDRTRAGEVLSRLTTDVGRVLDALVALAVTLVPDAVRLAVVLGLLITIDGQLAVVALGVVPLLAVLAVRQRHRVRGAQREARTQSGRLSALATDLLRNVRAVQAFGRQHRTGATFAVGNDSLLNANLEAVSTSARWAPIADVVLALGSGVVLVVGGTHVLQGRMSTGELLVVMSYLAALYSPVRSLSRLSGVLAKSTASAERLHDVLQCRERISDALDAVAAPTQPRTIRFTDVAFGYGLRRVLDGFNLDLHAGETVCLFGPSGAGKSTVLHLLLRLYDVDEGSIALDGVDVRAMTQLSLRRSVAFVPQDPWLFDASITDNIAYGTDRASRHGIETAARTALVDDFARRLPAGYETRVGEGGVQLSGGERRRVALARAIVSAAPVLALDEPTASLDSVSAQGVVAAIQRASAGHTVLLVTHDRELAGIADRVIHLDHARPPTVLSVTTTGRG
jgi:ATP-binding cassette subfamily B protein